MNKKKKKIIKIVKLIENEKVLDYLLPFIVDFVRIYDHEKSSHDTSNI